MSRSLLDFVLEPPSYGFSRDGKLYVPSHAEIFREFVSRVNPLKDRRNWIIFTCWFFSMALLPFFIVFCLKFFSWPLAIVGLIYSMGFLGMHGTIWFHRYATHRAYTFSHPIWRFLVKNLAIKIIPEETYVISHYVHHKLSEKAGDPYNVHAGWLYCFLADANHQPINRHLSENEYERVKRLMDHTGTHFNSYQQYLRWGSLCHPGITWFHFIANWIFWYSALYWIGGHALATAIFGISYFWAMGIRTFNYDGHGGGKDKRKLGVDFNWDDLSINQLWPGLVTGEWHNNHHLYPNGARAGFLWYQFDSAWWFIRGLQLLGGVNWLRDDLEEFNRKYYFPFAAGTFDPRVGALAPPVA